jgi:ABC-2 type transport system permease protein
MTAAVLPAPVRERRPLAGTGLLLGAALRRDRRRLAIWVASLGGVTVYATVALGLVYPTAADRQGRAAVIGTPAGTLLSGPGYGTDHYTLGAMIANELALSVMIAIAIMSILLVVRHTRAEEESGSAELLLTGSVGRRAPLSAALAVTAAADAAVALVVAAGLVGSGLAAVDSAALAIGIGLTGVVFAAVAAVTAQLLASARAASGTAMALLGVAVLVRGVGDVLRLHGSPLSWFSPLAWAQQTRAYVDLRWAPLLLLVALPAVLVPAAVALSTRRDVGAGLIAPRRGPAHASAWLAGPVGLVARLQRGSIGGWTVGLLALGATFGSLTDSVTNMVAGNPRLAQAFAANGTASITDSFTAATATYIGLCTAGFAVSSVLRVCGEEGSGRLELLLATRLSRRRFLGSGLGVSAAAGALLLVAAGLGSGVAAAAVSGHPGAVGAGLAAGLVQLPAVLVVAAVVAALVGISTRLAPLGWLLLVWMVLVGLFGRLLGLPASLARLSPFGWVPAVPAVPLDVFPLAVLTLLAGALTAVALLAYRRRDVAP